MKIIKDFLTYRKLINEFELKLDLSKEDKLKLSSYDKDFENKINDYIFYLLSKDLIKEEYSREYILGFRQALLYRNSLFRDYSSTTK